MKERKTEPYLANLVGYDVTADGQDTTGDSTGTGSLSESFLPVAADVGAGFSADTGEAPHEVATSAILISKPTSRIDCMAQFLSSSRTV